MPERIDPLMPSRPPEVSGADASAAAGAAGAGAIDGKSFKDVLADSLKEVNAMQMEAEGAIQDIATGKTDNVAEVMMAVEKADLAFKMLLQIRNKLTDAYDEVMRMRM